MRTVNSTSSWHQTTAKFAMASVCLRSEYAFGRLPKQGQNPAIVDSPLPGPRV